MASTQPTVNYGSIQITASWRQIETSPGVYDFTAVDAEVAKAESLHKQILLNLAGTPTFWASKPTQTGSFFGGGLGASSAPSNRTAWSNFVKALAAHYGTRVSYMAWNEPCVIGFWTGSKVQMVQMMVLAYNEVKAATAGAGKVVSPACPIRLSSQKTYLTGLYGTAYSGKKPANVIDVGAINPYPTASQTPENTLANVKWFRTMLNNKGAKTKPIWVTEVNYGMVSMTSALDLPDATQQSFIVRNNVLLAGSGIQRMQWFSWDMWHQGVKLTNFFDWVNLRPAGNSWQVSHSWLNNTSVSPCVKNSVGVYSCVVVGGGETRRIYWRTSGTSSVAAATGAFSKEDVNGVATPIAAATKFTVSTSPVMVRSH